MSKQETAAQLRKVANFFKGLIQAADDIEAIGSMEGATKEAAQARDLAVNERDQALAELADAKAKGAKAAKDAKEKVEGMLADAQAKADAKITEAQALVDKTTNDLISKAERQAAEMTDKAAASVQAAGQELANWAVKKGALMAEVADLEAKAKDARAEHEKLTKALDALKAKFKIAD